MPPIFTQYKYEIYIFLVFLLWAIAMTMDYDDKKAQECRNLNLQYNQQSGVCELWLNPERSSDQSKKISV